MGRNAYTYKKGYNGTLEERMANKTVKAGPDDCWLWIGGTTTSGYGTIRMGKIARPAHQIAFELYNNTPVPKGKLIMHSCDNPLCVNPKHLILGTKKLNNIDKMLKGRCNPLKGENHPMRKLTQKNVNAIRKIFSKGNHTYTKIAPLFNVNRTTISNIVNRRNWR